MRRIAGFILVLTLCSFMFGCASSSAAPSSGLSSQDAVALAQSAIDDASLAVNIAYQAGKLTPGNYKAAQVALAATQATLNAMANNQPFTLAQALSLKHQILLGIVQVYLAPPPAPGPAPATTQGA